MRLIILYMSTILYSYDMSTILYDYDIICDVYVFSRDVYVSFRDVCVYSRDVCVYSRDVYVPYDIVLHMIYDMMSLVLGDFSSGPMMLTEVSDCLLTSFCILPRFLAFSELSSFSTAMSLSFSAFLLVFSERFPCPLFYLALVDLDEEQKEKETIEMSVEMCLVTFTLFYWTCSIVLYCHVIYGMLSLVLGDFSLGAMMLTEVSDCTLSLVCILPRCLAFSELSSFSTAMSLSFSPFLLVFPERFPCPLFYLALVDLDEEQKEKETIEIAVEMYHVTFTFFYWTCSIVLYCHVIYGMVSLVQGDFSSGPDDATEVSDCSLSTVGISYGFLVFRLYRGRKVSGFASDLPPLLLPVFPLSYWHR